VTLQELQNRIKSASDKMRADDNTKNALRYLEQISWLLFLKVFDELEEERFLAAQVDGRSYQRVIPEELSWSTWTRRRLTGDELIEFITSQLLPGLRDLPVSGQSGKIAEIFNGVTTVMKSGYSLAEVIAIVNTIDIRSMQDHHALSVVYETLLAQTADAGWSGEFYTPRPIVEFIVDVIQPKLGETVYDPCCGSAGFLVAAAEYLKPQTRVGSDEVVLDTQTIFGQESGDLAHLVGVMNLMLHGITEPNLKRVNTLEQNVTNVSPEDQYSVILTNPPFGGTENPAVQQNFSARSAATELLFLQHCMSKLKAGGRCAIVLPDGVLYRSVTAFVTVRRRLLNEYSLEALVRLPTGVFPTAADTRTNILFFARHGRTEKIRFYQIHPPNSKRSYSKTNPLSREALRAAEDWILNGVPDENSWEVTRDQIDLIGNLDILWPGTLAAPSGGDAAERLGDLEQAAETLDQMVSDLVTVADGLDSLEVESWNELRGNVEETGARAGTSHPDKFVGVSNSGGLGPFKGTPGSDTSRYRRLNPGDFVYNPMRVNVGSIALCRTNDEAGWVSPDYIVFRLSDSAPFSADFLLSYLKSESGKEEISRQSRGAVRRRLYYENLESVRVPFPKNPDDWEAAISGMAALRAHARQLGSLSETAVLSLESALFTEATTTTSEPDALGRSRSNPTSSH
jgi:type I restriction enzyme M protein